MKDFGKLQLGFSDAENYRRRENKEFFNQVFVKDKYLDDLIQDNVFFLVGEKGTGKTAYAVFITNNNHNNVSSLMTYIRETEYQQFVVLKKEKHLVLSDFTNIWKVIIFLLLAEKLSQDEKEKSIFNYTKFRNLKKAIDDYYRNAFSPEIIQAMSFVNRSDVTAKLLSNYSEVGGKTEIEDRFSESKFQTNLFYIEKNLKKH